MINWFCGFLWGSAATLLLYSLYVGKRIQEEQDKACKCISNVDTEPYFVWKCKTLQNWKYLMSTDLHDGMYYELTYNGDKKEWYLDAYKKFENRCIPMPILKKE